MSGTTERINAENDGENASSSYPSRPNLFAAGDSGGAGPASSRLWSKTDTSYYATRDRVQLRSDGTIMNPNSPTYIMSKLLPRKKPRDIERSSELEKQLFAEWKKLSLDDSLGWIDGVKSKLGQDGNVLDYLDWADEQLELERARPNFSALEPNKFGLMLGKAKWNGDAASRIVFGRLWYARERDDEDLVLGWLDHTCLAVRLNGHLVNPKPSDLEASRKLGHTVLPPPLVALRYESFNTGSALPDGSAKLEESMSWS
jgi:hypothetical protein